MQIGISFVDIFIFPSPIKQSLNTLAQIRIVLCLLITLPFPIVSENSFTRGFTTLKSMLATN